VKEVRIMDIHRVTDQFGVSQQVEVADVSAIAAAGYRALVCNRPDGEGPDQQTFQEIEVEARKHGLDVRYLPVAAGKVRDEDAVDFARAYAELPKPVLAYCRTGTRSITLWSLSQATSRPLPEILSKSKAAGYDMSGVVRRIANGGKTPTNVGDVSYDIVVVGGGAAGIAVASSLMARHADLEIAIIEPADVHYYQPGWTMVGAGVFDQATTAKTMGSLIPHGVKWIKAAVAAFEPKDNAIILDGCSVVKYKRLIVCPGLKLDWSGIDGLADTLGKNGVTSNYRYDLAPYTWELVENLRSGRAVFTQPPMPIKCAGAPQKAMYLSADHWYRNGRLKDVSVEFFNAGGVLFGVKEYVPALMEYIERYDAKLNFFQNLIAIDGSAKKAWFDVKVPGEEPTNVEVDFDMIHVCPPQTAPDFIRVSPFADSGGWFDVDKGTLRHKTFDNVWSLGDVMNAPNAKTAAAVRKQAPVVAENIIADIAGRPAAAQYDGYGSCPLTVERGKVVLAEFGYDGVLLPSFPSWIIDGTKPSRAAWFLKEQVLPAVYWKAMLRGREWLASPEDVTAAENVAA
jgi:sulfide:quinone oxidoreductase